MANPSTITWLIWNKQTGKLMLEVRHVPEYLGPKTVAATIGHFGYWPVKIEDEGPESTASEYVALSTTLSAPGVILDQTAIDNPVRHVEWRAMWDEAADERRQRAMAQHNNADGI